MTDRKAGPIFKIGAAYLRTMIEPDGSRTVHRGDVRAAWLEDGTGPKATDPDVQKWLAWMRAGTPPKSGTLTIRKIPTHAAKLQMVTPHQAIGDAPGPMRYCRLFDAMRAFGLSAEEGREFVEAGALVLSAEHVTEPMNLEQMLIAAPDLIAFVQKTGMRFAPKVRH